MKKLLLLCASTMLLASCGGSGDNTPDAYVAEPTGGKVVAASELAAPATKLAAALAQKKAIGFELAATGSANASVKIGNAETVPAQFAGKTYGGSTELKDVKLVAGLKDGKASAIFSGGLKADVTIPMVSYDMETYEPKYEDKKVNFDVKASAAAYIDGNNAYVDATGLRDAYKSIMSIGTEINSSMEEELNVIFRKFSAQLPQGMEQTLAQAPAMVASYVGQFASMLTNWSEFISTAPAQIKTLLDTIEFKTYDGGKYGLHCKYNLQDVLKAVGQEIPAQVKPILDKITASVEAVVLFTETEFLSAGVEVKAEAKALDLKEVTENSIDTIDASAAYGLKLTLAYDDNVKVEAVPDKASFTPIN